MAKPPAGQKFDANQTLKTIFRAAEKIGVDGCLYIVVAIGTFGSITFGKADPYKVALATSIILGGWLANKVVHAVLTERHEQRELERLKLTTGAELLEIHKDRQRRLPFDGPNAAEDLRDDSNGSDDVDG